MMISQKIVILVGHHSNACNKIDSDSFIVRLNDHCPNCKCDYRIIGDPTIEMPVLKDSISVNAESKQMASHRWILNAGKDDVFHLVTSDLGVINTFPFLPFTGIVAINLLLSWGVEQIGLVNLDCFAGRSDTHIGLHELQPQQEYLAALKKTKKVVEYGY